MNGGEKLTGNWRTVSPSSHATPALRHDASPVVT